MGKMGSIPEIGVEIGVENGVKIGVGVMSFFATSFWKTAWGRGPERRTGAFLGIQELLHGNLELQAQPGVGQRRVGDEQGLPVEARQQTLSRGVQAGGSGPGLRF